MDECLSNTITRLRGVAILVVVFFHVCCPILSWGGYNKGEISEVLRFLFYDFLGDRMMPTFFLISGTIFFSKTYGKTRDLLIIKTQRLLIPYCIIFTICVLLNFPRIGNSVCFGHLWFLWTLFCCFWFASISRFINPLLIQVIAIIFALIYNLVPSYFGLPNFLKYYIWFHLGYWMYHHFHDICTLKVPTLMLVLCLFFVSLIFHQPYSITILLFNIVMFAIFVKTDKFDKYIIPFSNTSFGIYLLHHVIIYALLSNICIMRLYDSFSIYIIPVLFVFVLYISYFLTRIINKFGFHYF